tara:strand:+ start:7392 stop:7985 length:594 start_codon:yes stop_codon:yes gene_type:complete
MSECPKCQSRNVKQNSFFEHHNLNECLDCKSIFTSEFEDCCLNPDTILVIEHYSNNRTRLFKQCSKCGGAFRNIQFAFKTHGNLFESEFSQINFDNWKKKKSDENKIISEYFDVFRKSKFYNYHKYLKSAEWKIIRDKVIERDNGICLYCKTKPAQEVHHKHYRTIYKEKIDDLESVCSDCHRAIHKSVFAEVLKGH